MANIEDVHAQPEVFGIIDESKSYLYEELWKLCAGSLVDLPKLGEKVYYFPQGHKEQLEASTNEVLEHVKPLFDLPSKLRCRVMSTRLEVEKDTDEVYAQITLIPDKDQINIPTANNNQQRPIVRSFTKVLASSDTNTSSGLFIHKKHAIECLPPLDMTQPKPTQELVTKDLHGFEWRFRHVARDNKTGTDNKKDTQKRHLFTYGWSDFAKAKGLTAGDCFILLVGENGQLHVGIRKTVPRQGSKLSSLISPQGMYHGVIASAGNALNTNCAFVVNYKPRTSQFIIRFDKYVDAMNNNLNVGSIFTMQFEAQDLTEKRYYGTVVKVEDFSSNWKDSEWRSLEVRWEDHASIVRPNRVSPWELTKLAPSTDLPQTTFLGMKRVCPVDEIALDHWSPTLTQGQEIGQSSNSSRMTMSSYSIPIMSNSNNTNQMVIPVKEKITTCATASCRLFGVDLASSSKIPIEPINSYEKTEIAKLSKERKLDQIMILTSPKEDQSKQIDSTRSCTKVQMQGLAVGRAVNLAILGGYNQLINELETLFDLKGELHAGNQWEIVFTNNKGDMMLVRNHPWPEFCNIVKKIFIYSKEEVKKMNLL